MKSNVGNGFFGLLIPKDSWCLVAGSQKIFCILSDTLMNSVHANEGYRHSLRRQLDLNSITLVLSTGCWDIKQVKSVCNPVKMELKSRITIHEA